MNSHKHKPSYQANANKKDNNLAVFAAAASNVAYLA